MKSEVIVNVPVANMYKEPKVQEITSQVIMGEVIKVLDEFHDFLYIEARDGYRGFILRNSVSYIPKLKEIVVIKEPLVNAYKEPSVRSNLVYTLPIGSILIDTHESKNGYRAVSSFTGELFYIQENTFFEQEYPFEYKKTDCISVIKTSLQFLNVPYLWGGKTPFGFDCSGLVQMVFFLNGINLKRDAHMQAEMEDLLLVQNSSLLPCDLLFFGKERIDHVGMYLGQGKFIHSTTFNVPKVQITDLKLFLDKLVLIRRVKW